MARNFIKVIILGLMVVGGWVGLSVYDKNSFRSQLAEKDQQIEAEKQKNDLLREIVKRIQTSKRVARVVVTDQHTADGRTETTLLFGEYARDGKSLLPEKRFVIEGTGAHIDAYVVQFDGKYVEENDPLRGHSVALFKRIFGDNQAPNSAFVIDSPGVSPEVYAGADPRQADYEKELWKDFWKLADDADYRGKLGVKLAYGSSTFREEFKKGYIYTLTLDPVGGLRMTSEKMDPLWERSLEEASKKPQP